MIIIISTLALLMLFGSISTPQAAPMQGHFSAVSALLYPLNISPPEQTIASQAEARQTHEPDTAYINRLNALAEEYSYRTAAVKDTATLYAAQALGLAEKIGYKRGIAGALAVLSYRFILEGKIEQGLDVGFKQLRVAEEFGDERLIARGLICIGFAAGQQSHADVAAIKEARERLLKALTIAMALPDDFLISFSCNALGRLARIEERQQEALAYHQQALGFAKKIQNSEQISWALHSLAVIYESQKQYALALDYAKQSLALREQNGRAFAVAVSLRLIGFIYFRLGQFEEAKRYAERSIAASKDEEGLFLPKMQAYQLLSDAYLALHKPAEALQYYKTSIAIRDSAAAIESKSNILQLQAQLDRERRTREEAIAHRDRQLQAERFQRQRVIGAIIISALVLLSIIVAMLWRTNQLKNKQNTELTVAYQEIKQQQETLEAQAQEIEIANTQLQETNEILAASNAELDKANTFKLNMLSIAAHDLKNPLHAIGNFADLIGEESENKDENITMFAGRISQICARMLALIHDLLDTAAHDLGKMTLQIEPVNISDLALAVTEQYTPQAKEKEQEIYLENHSECWVAGDAQRLYQVLENLLSNAVKYSPQGKRIWLTVSIRSEQGIASLSLKDEGPGMTSEDQEKAFTMFQRLSAQTTGGESSTGVGLALVKQIVELHNGRVHIVSAEGGGTEFIVELPLYLALSHSFPLKMT